MLGVVERGQNLLYCLRRQAAKTKFVFQRGVWSSESCDDSSFQLNLRSTESHQERAFIFTFCFIFTAKSELSVGLIVALETRGGHFPLVFFFPFSVVLCSVGQIERGGQDGGEKDETPADRLHRF